ncbi:hypothetical protein CXF97_14430 [Pseudomonas sp. Choline-02u-1]|nr:hypothetical protein CXF97_14430 [Pseudomonas sp. Choline-02u-1]
MTLRFREQARSHRGIGGVGRCCAWRQLNVGVGLLTKREVHSAMMLPDLPLSRASSLPHWLYCQGRREFRLTIHRTC